MEILMLVFGIITLITGKFTVSRGKVVRGVPARSTGLVMILPLPLALGAVVLIGVILVATGQAADEKMVRLVVTIVEASIVGICFVIAMIIARVNAEPSDRPRRRREDYDEGYDREEYDRPDDHDDPDRPRRGSDDRIHRPPDDRFRE
jgi:hypothetical protein